MMVVNKSILFLWKNLGIADGKERDNLHCCQQNMNPGLVLSVKLNNYECLLNIVIFKP